MKLTKLLASFAVLAAAAGPALADCTSTTNLGLMGPPGLAGLGNSFSSAGTYHDCYTFSLAAESTAFGGTLEIDPWLDKLDIDVQSISLAGGTLSSMLLDSTPGTFSFGSLGAGTYTLTVNSLVTRAQGLFNVDVGYSGLVATVAAPVPEPGTYALMLAGLGALGWVARRRRVL